MHFLTRYLSNTIIKKNKYIGVSNTDYQLKREFWRPVIVQTISILSFVNDPLTIIGTEETFLQEILEEMLPQ